VVLQKQTVRFGALRAGLAGTILGGGLLVGSGLAQTGAVARKQS
jgi:hypothetical protein